MWRNEGRASGRSNKNHHYYIFYEGRLYAVVCALVDKGSIQALTTLLSVNKLLLML